MIDLRVGRWQDVLVEPFDGAPITCDAVIGDPPYSDRTHDQEEGTRYDGFGVDGMRPSYACWTKAEIDEFVDAWSPRCRGWMAMMTSHDLVPHWEAAYERVDRYCFAPVPCVIRGMTVRRSADGPSSWSVSLVVARPRTKIAAAWGTLPGAYIVPRQAGAGGGRGKPDWLMRAIVGDYSRRGDVVVDPFAGWGSTLIAADGLGRTAIGCDVDPAAVEEARRRIARGTQQDLFA